MAILRRRKFRNALLLLTLLSGLSYVTISFHQVDLKQTIMDASGVSSLWKRFTELPKQILRFQLNSASLLNLSMVLQGSLLIGDRSVDRSAQLILDMDPQSWRHFQSALLKRRQRAFPWKPFRVQEMDCAKLFQGNEQELNHTLQIQRTQVRPPTPPEVIVQWTQNCKTFIEENGFITRSLTKEEENFPIAFSILTFKDAEQVLFLLRAIYRPQNYYCIHVDNKSNHTFRLAIQALTTCFDNVFMASRSVNVTWGDFSVLEPELICLQDLWQYKSWKYFMNLVGQEFPLKTNWELVQILTTYNGSNDLEGTVKRANQDRWAAAKSPAPHGIKLIKGSVHVAVNRAFVHYVLHNQTAKDFLDWSKQIPVVDEMYFASLNHNPQLGIPGSYLGEPETDPVKKPFLTRFKNWESFPFNYKCAGNKRVREICILSVGDLPLLQERKEMFANKFYWDYSYYALQCLAERHYNNTRDEYLGDKVFDLSYYQNLSFVKNKVPVGSQFD